MMEEATVTQVVDNFAKHGHSEKTNKDWSMSRVGLSNGESVFIFNPIEVGDVVEAKQNGDYKNWQKKKVDPKHDDMMKALRSIYAKLTAIEARIARLEGEPDTEPAPAPRTAPTAPRASTAPMYGDDVVVDDVDDPINLSDIPF